MPSKKQKTKIIQKPSKKKKKGERRCFSLSKKKHRSKSPDHLRFSKKKSPNSNKFTVYRSKKRSIRREKY